MPDGSRDELFDQERARNRTEPLGQNRMFRMSASEAWPRDTYGVGKIRIGRRLPLRARVDPGTSDALK